MQTRNKLVAINLDASLKGEDINSISDVNGMSLLHGAAKIGDILNMEALLAKGAPTNVQDHNGLIPLAYAIENGQLEAILLLLEMGSKINTVYCDYFSTIQRFCTSSAQKNASFTAWIATLENLIDLIYYVRKYKIDASEVSKIISLMGQCLLESQHDINAIVNEADITFWHLLAMVGDIKLMQAFWDQGFKVEKQVKNIKQALYYAIQEGQLESVQFLVHCPAVQVAVDISREEAIEYINVTVRLLTEVQDSKESNVAAAHIIILLGRFLWKYCQDIAILSNDCGMSFVHFGALVGDVALVEAFLNHNKSIIHYRTTENKTPLYFAVQNAQLAMVDLLIARYSGIQFEINESVILLNALLALISSIQAEDIQEKKIPKMVAKISQFLLQRIPEENISKISDDNHTTLLHYAAMVGNISLIETLQKIPNIDLNVRDLLNKNALHYAIQYGQAQAVACLLPQILSNHVPKAALGELQNSLYELHNLDILTVNALGTLQGETQQIVQNFLMHKQYQVVSTPFWTNIQASVLEPLTKYCVGAHKHVRNQ